MKSLITTVAMIALGAVSLPALAAQDEGQRLITQRLQEQKLKLAAAEKAQGAERDRLMQDHMKMMQETIGKMQAMKPREGMTPQEQKEWIAEHQKLMQLIMDQMVTEHHMMMQGSMKGGMPMKDMPMKDMPMKDMPMKDAPSK